MVSWTDAKLSPCTACSRLIQMLILHSFLLVSLCSLLPRASMLVHDPLASLHLLLLSRVCTRPGLVARQTIPSQQSTPTYPGHPTTTRANRRTQNTRKPLRSSTRKEPAQSRETRWVISSARSDRTQHRLKSRIWLRRRRKIVRVYFSVFAMWRWLGAGRGGDAQSRRVYVDYREDGSVCLSALGEVQRMKETDSGLGASLHPSPDRPSTCSHHAQCVKDGKWTGNAAEEQFWPPGRNDGMEVAKERGDTRLFGVHTALER